MNIQRLNEQFNSVKTKELYGRYITNSHIEPCLYNLPKSIVSIIGYSVEQHPIYGVKLGTGPKRILMWSQMHGNESTTTKALFDCFNLLRKEDELSGFILKECTLLVIPILNPDGAKRYTRLNANNVDLNRDAQDLTQPESRVLREAYTTFKPHFCFNLHGQRTIFGAGFNGNAATLSFLSPAQDERRSLTPNRKMAMGIIAQLYTDLLPFIPNGIGRYDDGFNLNCVGDTFQSLGTPTILYETGHFPNDYQREEVRRLAFLALMKGITIISSGAQDNIHNSYTDIPENVKNYRDIGILNAATSANNKELKVIAIQLKEVLEGDEIKFVPVVDSVAASTNFKFHYVINANGKLVRTISNTEIKAGYENDFVLINNKKTALKS